MKILLTILGCLVVAAAGGLVLIYSGIYDVSATTPDSAIVAWAVHTTSDRSVGARLGAIKVPSGLDQPAMIEAGAHLFSQNCSVCHGGPGLERTNISRGLNPQPPDLFRASRVPEADENFRFIKYGVKMTAMPGFAPTQTDEQIWSLVAFLSVAPGMTAPDYSSKSGAKATELAPSAPAGG